MDLGSIYWVGNMYQRFESLRLEADETMYQDTVNYVEEQMHTIGASVKKFYLEVMQDLLPQSSSNTVIEENPLLIEVHHADVAVEEQCANKDFESQCAELDLPNPDIYATKDLDDRKDSERKFPSDTASLNASVTTKSSEELAHSEVHNESSEQLCGVVDASLRSASVLEVSYSRKDGVGIAEQMTVDNGGVDVVNGGETTASTSGNTSPDFDGTSNALVACKIQSGDADKEVLFTKQLNKVKLGESCVLVEKREHSITMPLDHKRKSYKKKIRDVFIPRRWSKGKQVEEQLAVWYEELNGEDLIPTPPRHVSNKDSQLCESFESEWELL